MRDKKIILIILFFVLSAITYGKGFIGINGNLFFPSDSDYNDIYGSSVINPEIEIMQKVSNKLFVFGSYGYMSKTGNTLGDLEVDTKSTRNILSVGAGYGIMINENADIIIKLGMSRIGYKEEAMGESVSGNKFGILFGTDLLYKIGNRFFTKLTIGYMSGRDNIDGVDIKLGGFKAGVGLGIRF